MTDAEICRWDLEPDRDRLAAETEAIFFAASATQSFANEAAKSAFRERWLGRYLSHYPQHVLLALDGERRVAGYLVGAYDDLADAPLFADLPFVEAFRAVSRRYPAHLHVNLAEGWRGRGIGRRLVEAFAASARESGLQGVHVVTQRGMRNVGFYLSNGFVERAATVIDGRELLFLGRDL